MDGVFTAQQRVVDRAAFEQVHPGRCFFDHFDVDVLQLHIFGIPVIRILYIIPALAGCVPVCQFKRSVIQRVFTGHAVLFGMFRNEGFVLREIIRVGKHGREVAHRHGQIHDQFIVARGLDAQFGRGLFSAGYFFGVLDRFKHIGIRCRRVRIRGFLPSIDEIMRRHGLPV